MLPKHRENASVALSHHHSPRPRAANGCETGSSSTCISLERKKVATFPPGLVKQMSPSEWGLSYRNRHTDQISLQGFLFLVHATSGTNTENSTLTPAGDASECTSPGPPCSLMFH